MPSRWSHRGAPLVLVLALALMIGLGLVPSRARAESAQEETPPAAPSAGPAASEPDGASGLVPKLKFGLEARMHWRDSQDNFFPVNFPFTPDQLPVGQAKARLETVNPGSHFEVSVVTLYADATWSETVAAHAKIDVIDLYDRNPTSSDQKIDVDEAWIRFGRLSEPATLPEHPGAYLKIGKMAKLERQNDRHLESYGLVSTAFNRFEDSGVELGVDLGRHFYLKGSYTQGNPVFFRDPNALAGDNGTPAFQSPIPHPDPELHHGILILYDAEVEDFQPSGHMETGAAIGMRFADATGTHSADLMLWGYRRTLADKVDLNGTTYSGDLGLLRGPFGQAPLPIKGDEKRDKGANFWLYLGGFSFFGQYVDQDIAGLGRKGYEGEAAWSFDLPLVWATGGRQLFPTVAPAVRYSRLEPDFRPPSQYPAPSVAWDWTKIDYGVRLGIVSGIDLTVEYADNDFLLFSGRHASNNELLTTLRLKM